MSCDWGTGMVVAGVVCGAGRLWRCATNGKCSNDNACYYGCTTGEADARADAGHPAR
ncbi:hypothetical protein GCM10028799_21040 [Kribbella italica]